MAISKINGPQQYNNVCSAKKSIVKPAVAAGVAAGAVLYMAKTGKLDASENGNKFIEGAKALLKKPADFVLNKAKELTNLTKFNTNTSVITDQAGKTSTKAGEKISDITGGISKVI